MVRPELREPEEAAQQLTEQQVLPEREPVPEVLQAVQAEEQAERL